MKTAVLVAALLVLSFLPSMPVAAAPEFTYVKVAEDLTITSADPKQYAHGFNVTGRATLRILTTDLKFATPRGYPSIILSESSTLVAENSTLYAPNGFQVYAQNQAHARIRGCRLYDAWVDIEAFSGVTLADGSRGDLRSCILGYLSSRDSSQLTADLVECESLQPRSYETTTIRRSLVEELRLLFRGIDSTLSGSLSGYHSSFDSQNYLQGSRSLPRFLLLETYVRRTTVALVESTLECRGLEIDRIEVSDSTLNLQGCALNTVDLQQGTVKVLVNGTTLNMISSFAHHIDVTILDSDVMSADLGFTGSAKATLRNTRLGSFFLDPASFPAFGEALIVDSAIDGLLIRARNTRITFIDSAVILLMRGVYTACKDGEQAVIRGSLLTSANMTAEARTGGGAIIREYSVAVTRRGISLPDARVDLWYKDQHLNTEHTGPGGTLRFNVTFPAPPPPKEDAEGNPLNEPEDETEAELVVRHSGETASLPLTFTTPTPIRIEFPGRAKERWSEPLASAAVMLLLLFLGRTLTRR